MEVVTSKEGEMLGYVMVGLIVAFSLISFWLWKRFRRVPDQSTHKKRKVYHPLPAPSETASAPPPPPVQPGAAPLEMPEADEVVNDSYFDLISEGESESAAPPAPARPEPKACGGLHKREADTPPQAPTRAGHAEDRSVPSETMPPVFTAFYPEAVKPSSPYALMVFVHLDSARAQVEEIAKGFAGIMGGAQSSAGTTSAIRVDVGSLITFVPVIDGITFDAVERVMTWGPPYQSATFLFTTPATLPETLAGRVLVYQGPLIIGEIPVQMQVAAADQPVSTLPGKSGEMRRLQPVFASYSHRDTPVMEYFRRSYERLGQKMLVDVYDLRSGEHWADRLLEMIEESAVFQLFWSHHSAQSKYCRQEWECALKYLKDRPRFIRPVWWQDPMPVPPSELAGLHFQRVPLPVLTRMQVIAAKVRGLLE